ncbi:hypothetical protein SKAU_G00030450 [Synaphobranchus kaupii]|uniref:Uncharacterized protein n=1 Tax=Synaphobranchus kaupii TaxID=118154 RepID=A0A9Q1GE61_SYNKA|nr:hypothetical protein SKAU_G00030450 [Synaphobranchus kaupii]
MAPEDDKSDIIRALPSHSAGLSRPPAPRPPATPTTPTTPATPATPLSPGAPVGVAKHTCSHLHTIGGMGGHKNICGRCNQKKWPLMRRSSKGRGERRSQYGEVTMLSVGRFRVTKCDPKPAKTRRTLLITEANGAMPPSPTATEHGAMPPSPTATEPRSRTTSEQQEENDSAKLVNEDDGDEEDQSHLQTDAYPPLPSQRLCVTRCEPRAGEMGLWYHWRDC